MRAHPTKSPLLVLLLSLPLAGLAGCGSSSGIEKVVIQGAVTYDNQPIANGEIRFYPTEDTRGPVSGGPIKDGKYIAKGGGGVPVGKHRVDIRAFRPDPRHKADPEGGPVLQYLPDKFNAQTTLTVTVSPRETTLDFALTSN